MGNQKKGGGEGKDGGLWGRIWSLGGGSKADDGAED